MELKYIFYLTVNTINGKFYFGVHETNPDTFDGYIGDGIYRPSCANKNNAFHRAVRKYGYLNFKRTTILVFPYTEEGKLEAFALEREVVNETLLRSKTCYNTAIGGKGAPDIKLKKRVYMFTIEGNYLRSFNSAKEAALSLKVDDVTCAIKAIRNNCLGKTQSSLGYFWSYSKKFTHKKSNKWRKVAQYTLSGKFIRTFESITEAEEELHLSTIQQSISKGYTSGGYQWKYFEDTADIPKYISICNKNKCIPIIMISKDKSIVKYYNSVSECVADNSTLNLSSSQINRVLHNDIKSHKGYVFKYQDDDIVRPSLK